MEQIFYCPEESRFYACCLKFLVMESFLNADLIEFGAGDGLPVIEAIAKTGFRGTVQGYEINSDAFEKAVQNIRAHGLEHRYSLVRSNLFDHSERIKADILIANPPYLPSPNQELILPELYGGDDGTWVIGNLLSLDFKRAMILIPSFSNPAKIIAEGAGRGYRVCDFLISRLPFGRYSSQDQVLRTIEAMKAQRLAFFSPNGYLIAGVLFEKREYGAADLSAELIRILACLDEGYPGKPLDRLAGHQVSPSPSVCPRRGSGLEGCQPR